MKLQLVTFVVKTLELLAMTIGIVSYKIANPTIINAKVYKC